MGRKGIYRIMTAQWKILKTGLSGSSSETPRMWVDEWGTAHCCWILGDNLKYSRFMGFDWECLGENVASSDGVSIYKSCIAINENRQPVVLYRDSGELCASEWDGFLWNKISSGFEDEDVLGASIIGQSPLLVFCFCSESGSKTLKCFQYNSGTDWDEKGEINLPNHDNEAYDLVSFKVGDSYYLFWKMSYGVDTWIGNAIYSTSLESFYGGLGLEIKSSRGAGDFSLNAGKATSLFDYSLNSFVKTNDEGYLLMSSSSSSISSSLSSETSSLSDSSITSTSSSVSSGP